jgi:glycosyltransferase involved in cell wall biosynthesis
MPASEALSLDIIIPTFNRSRLLRECLESVFGATTPPNLTWRVTVVDNKSSDDTKQVVESFMEDRRKPIRYLFEAKLGRSAAANCGISESNYLLTGFLDDDEQVAKTWLETIERSFRQNPNLDFIGGPYLGLWRTTQPSWLPREYSGVLSADNPEEIPKQPVAFPHPAVFLRGGNAVIRRSVFDRIGGYALHLGRFGTGFGSCEDHDFYRRMLDADMQGLFVPELIIYHVVPPERVTRSYYRKWAWGHAVSLSEMTRLAPEEAPHVGRIPRYVIGEALRTTPDLLFGDQRNRFSAELRWWTLAGLFWGAYVKKSP